MKTSRRGIGLRLLVAWQQQRHLHLRSCLALRANGLCLGLLAVSLILNQAVAAEDAAQDSKLSRPFPAHEVTAVPPKMVVLPRAAHPVKRANFELERASIEARQVADWVVDSNDNRGMPFVIVDKKDAKVFVFEGHGRLRGAAAALLGLALGDDSVPGIGQRAMSSIRPEERTTPAGRFVAALDRNLRGEEILWVDYDTAISLHPVIAGKPEERRAQRLSTVTPLDNRISYGCINVPVKFFENVVRPAFTGTDGIVYVLPETRLARQVLASYDVEQRARLLGEGQPEPTRIATGAARD